MVATIVITFGVSLVFSRLTNNFKNEYGGSYNYTKKLNNKHFSFFVGWNQYVQGPILASSSPLFLASAISDFLPTKVYWIVSAISMILFIILVLVSTMGLKLNKYVVLVSGIVKWLILLAAFVIVVYLAITNHNSVSSSTGDSTTTYLIFSNIISFMYAFGGIEDVSAMSNDVKFKNFRKIIMVAFAFILTFYFIFYIVLVFAGKGFFSEHKNFANIFKAGLGTTGIWIFFVGILFNGISAKISIAVATSRKIVPLANDGFLFSFLTRKNNKGEFKNAIWFSAVITVLSMVVFYLIPTFLHKENFFESVIELGSVAFLLQYFLTFLVAFILEKKKIISKIPVWEKIVYVLAMAIIFSALMVFLFPVIVGKKWEEENTIILVSYFVFIGLGYLFKFISKKFNEWSLKKENTKLKKGYSENNILSFEKENSEKSPLPLEIENATN